jgi:hypothetical protein
LLTSRERQASYACVNCCPASCANTWVNPGSVIGFPGDTTQFTAQQQNEDCFGNLMTPFTVGSPTWSSTNSSVASVSGGLATALSVGTTNIGATWTAFLWDMNPNNTCTKTTIHPDPTALCDVRPRIDSITPGRGLINSTIGVSIIGAGFAGSSTVSVAGTGVTASVQSSSSTSLSVNLNISANATPGDHGVTVTTSGKTSNSVNFFVQVPTSLRRDSISGVNDQLGGCGATRTLAYHLLDQEGAEISSGDSLKETFSNYSGPAGVAPPTEKTVQMASGVATDTVGYQIPTCPAAFTATFTQTFTVVIGAQSYALTSSNAISMGRTGSGTKFVDITFTQ